MCGCVILVPASVLSCSSCVAAAAAVVLCVVVSVYCCQIVMISEQISYEEKRDLAKQLQDKQVGGGGRGVCVCACVAMTNNCQLSCPTCCNICVRHTL